MIKQYFNLFKPPIRTFFTYSVNASSVSYKKGQATLGKALPIAFTGYQGKVFILKNKGDISPIKTSEQTILTAPVKFPCHQDPWGVVITHLIE